jgi:DNA-binding MarR family transcriptional regulator
MFAAGDRTMTTPFEHLSSLNRLVHEPARLAILVALSACDRADFLFLLNITGLTKGNLSSHLSKLEQAGLVEVEKKFEGKTSITYLTLTLEGKEALKAYWKSVDKVRSGIKHLKPLRAT